MISPAITLIANSVVLDVSAGAEATPSGLTISLASCSGGSDDSATTTSGAERIAEPEPEPVAGATSIGELEPIAEPEPCAGLTSVADPEPLADSKRLDDPVPGSIFDDPAAADPELAAEPTPEPEPTDGRSAEPCPASTVIAELVLEPDPIAPASGLEVASAGGADPDPDDPDPLGCAIAMATQHASAIGIAHSFTAAPRPARRTCP